MFRKLMCKVGLHKWFYIKNDHGGQPMVRQCLCCQRLQTWNYSAAREHGVIQWENV